MPPPTGRSQGTQVEAGRLGRDLSDEPLTHGLHGAVSRTDRIVRELVRPGAIYRDTKAVRTHTIVGNVDDARALFDTISAGGREVTTPTYQNGGTLMLLCLVKPPQRVRHC